MRLTGAGAMKQNLRRAGSILASLCLLLAAAHCGGSGGGNTPPGVQVTITSPTTAQTVPVKGTLAITAAVANGTSSGVTWTVNGVANGNSTYGTISVPGSGSSSLSVTYTAPQAVPSTATFNITATSVADSSVSASLSVTISSGVVISITTPSSPQSISVSSTVAFTASVTGSSNTGVTWTVNSVANGNSTFGTITGTGLNVSYNAPSAVPTPATFNVTATSTADATKSASVSVTITPGVGVSITSPAGAQDVAVNATLAFTASVTGTSNTGLTWTVNGVTNGNATYGTITGSGLSVTYTAPAAIPSLATFNVTATSTADVSKSASVAVTITSAITVSITSPSTSSASVAANTSLALTASVTGTSNTAITWAVDGVTNGNATVGTISGSGLSVTYDAPAAVPSPATFSITATSQADTSKSASLSVTITPAATLACGSGNESILSGQYAFQLKGFNSGGFAAAVGSITVDGAGHITGGEVDVNGTGITAAVNSKVSASPASFYSVGSDNRGCATIVTVAGSTLTTRFDLGVVSLNAATQGEIMEFDSASSSAFIATGRIFKQAPADFTVLQGGAYVHLLTGWDSVAKGRIACGGVHTNSGGNISNSEETCNDVGTVATTGPNAGSVGSYTNMDSNGRFTETVGASTLVAYFLAENQNTGVPSVLTLTTNTNPVMAGEAIYQTQNTYSQSSLVSDYVIYASGVNNSTSGKIFLASAVSDGAGTLTLSSYNENDGGAWLAPGVLPAYTYNVDYLGGVSLTKAPAVNAGHLYLTGGAVAVYIGADTGAFAGYSFAQTSSGALSNATLKGTFFGGAGDIVNQAATAECDLAVLNGTGGLAVTTDDTSTSSQAAGQATTDTITIAPIGTLTNSANPSQVTGIVINPNFFVVGSNTSSAYPVILLLTLNAPPV